jgi:hypothetical protein
MREELVQVEEDQSEPNKVKLTNGSFLQWDYKDGFYRVAYYERSARKGSDLEMTISVAMKKPLHNFRVKNIFAFISKTDEYAATGT